MRQKKCRKGQIISSGRGKKHRSWFWQAKSWFLKLLVDPRVNVIDVDIIGWTLTVNLEFGIGLMVEGTSLKTCRNCNVRLIYPWDFWENVQGGDGIIFTECVKSTWTTVSCRESVR
jgi:hypothetical protein